MTSVLHFRGVITDAHAMESEVVTLYNYRIQRKIGPIGICSGKYWLITTRVTISMVI